MLAWKAAGNIWGVDHRYLQMPLKNDIGAATACVQANTWTDRDTGETKDTVAIITTKANKLMEQVHNSKMRMPVVFTAAAGTLPALECCRHIARPDFSGGL
jgi:hypothetical protein